MAAASAQTTTSPAPADTMAPAPVSSPLLTPTNAPEPTAKPAPKAKPQIKHLKTATLPTSQVAYALTHQISTAKQLTHMKTIDFNNIRV